MTDLNLLMAATEGRAGQLRADAMRRLGEIADHGCEAASARSFEEGRLAVLDALALGLLPLPGWPFDEAIINQRRLDLDEALNPNRRGNVGSEPIVTPRSSVE